MQTPAFTVLVAPSGFKESLSVRQATDIIASGVESLLPDARVLKAPVVDGGEGFTEAIVGATGGTLHNVTVTGPVGEPVMAHFGFMGGEGPRTAVIEMAAAAGLSLVPRDRRDPTRTTSHGVGELITAALDAGARRILLGCGDSGINDAGVGMAQALGIRFRDAAGLELGRGGGELVRLASIDMSGRDPRLARVPIDVAVNPHNQLLGERGVARVFARQKGASDAQIELLEAGLINVAVHAARATGIDVAHVRGAGASGGLGAGLAAFCGARLHPRFDIVMRYLDFDRLLEEADLVITAEGAIDHQTPFGKVPAEVGRRARARGVQTIALAGTLGPGAALTLAHGIDAFASIVTRPCSLDEAIEEAEPLLRRATRDALRLLIIGARLGERVAPLRRAA